MTKPRAIPLVDVHLDDDRGVAILTPKGVTDRTVVAILGYRAWLDPFELQRFRLIAGETSSRIVVPENPGCGARAARTTPREKFALARGDFSPFAARALEQVAPWIDDGPAHLLGYSMGSSVAAAMLATGSGFRPVTTTFVEPVAAGSWSVRQLLRALEDEDRATDESLDTNDAWSGAALPWDRTPGAQAPCLDRPTLAASGLGIARGRILHDVTQAADRGGQPGKVVLVRGDRSLLCTSPSMLALREALDLYGVDVDELVFPGRHALWHSLDTVRSIAVRLANIWQMQERSMHPEA